MAIGRKAIWFGVGGAVVLTAAIVYEVVLPNKYGNSYKSEIRAAASTLDASLTKVADGVTRPVFTNPDSTSGSDKNDLVIIKDSLTDAEAKLRSFDEATKKLKKLPLSGFFGSYSKAKDMQRQSKETADQVRQRLGAYKELVVFLDSSNQSMIKFEEQTATLDELETSTDVDKMSKAMKDGAGSLRTLAREMKNHKAPADFKDIRDREVALVEELAAPFEQMGNALATLDGDGIDAAMESIGSVIEKGEAVDKDIRAKIGQDSSYIRGVKELASLMDKLV